MLQKREEALNEIKKLSSLNSTQRTNNDENQICKKDSGILNETFQINQMQISQEAKYIKLLKKDLEVLYKEFLKLIPDNVDQNKALFTSFINYERKLNESVNKAQDLMDYIEDLNNN